MNGMSSVFQNHLEVLLDRSIKNDFCVQDLKKKNNVTNCVWNPEKQTLFFLFVIEFIPSFFKGANQDPRDIKWCFYSKEF